MTNRTKKPVAFAFGLLAAAAVVLIGIWRDVSPEVILLRAGVSGAVVGLLTWLARIVLSEDGKEERPDSTR